MNPSSLAEASRRIHVGSVLACTALSSLLMVSCNLSRTLPTDGTSTDTDPAGSARLIAAKGLVLRLGSDDPQAAPEERPGWTRFTHDFWMDTVEFTQKEFQALLGRNPSKVKGDELPVTDVTWFDAVLAANARSKRDHLDTAYEYSATTLGADGVALDLSGLSIHADRQGWRLPTEAEWELAARAGTTTPYPWGSPADSAKARQYAWFQANASGTIHPVGTLAPNAWGLHDLAGNVMEWVQDWKGPFPKDTVADFAGQALPGDVADVPVKGGAAKFGSTFLRPSNRSATYASGRNARTEYVGFRLVRGSMRASFVDLSGAALQIPQVRLATMDIASLSGARNAKLVFVNRSAGRGILAWVDYAEPTPIVRFLPDSFPVFHPAISPDGNWVAWSTALEGSTSPSRIRIRRLNTSASKAIDLGEGAIPRWWVDGTDTFLIRAQAMDNLSGAWASSRTTMRRWSGWNLESTETILSKGSFHDGRSGHFLYTGYRRLIQHDVLSGVDRILFTGPQNGKGAGDTSQVCNTSAAPDTSGRVLFLDFGFGGRSSVVGRPYGIHEVAFVADSTGRILQNISAPPGEQQWDHLEWSNHPRWAVASVQNGTGANHAIHLLDLESGSSTALATGEDLWHAGLWVSANPTIGPLSIDSAGDYYTPQKKVDAISYSDAVLEETGNKLATFWYQRDSIEYAFVGSSQIGAAIKRAGFQSGKAFNWGISGNRTYGDDRWIRDYLIGCPRLKVVGISFMPAWILEEDGLDHWQAASNSIGWLYDKNHGFWKDSGTPAHFVEQVEAKAPTSLAILNRTNGEWYTYSTGWGSSTPRLFVFDDLEAKAPELSRNLQILRKLGEDLAKRGIHLLIINFPHSPAYRNTKYAGAFGPTWNTYERVIDSAMELQKASEFVHFYDAHKSGLHDYDSLDFSDESHLSNQGGLKLSRRLDSIIESWSQNKH